MDKWLFPPPLSRQLDPGDPGPTKMPISKKPKLSRPIIQLRPSTPEPDVANTKAVLQKFWRGDILTCVENSTMATTIASKVKLSKPPNAKLIDLLGNYRKTFGSAANPFRAMQWLEFLERTHQVQDTPEREDGESEDGESEDGESEDGESEDKEMVYEELQSDEEEIGMMPEFCISSLYLTPHNFPAQQLCLSPSLAVRTNVYKKISELGVQRDRMDRLEITLDQYREQFSLLAKALKEEHAVALQLINEMTGRVEVTIQEHRTPPRMSQLLDIIAEDEDRGLRELLYESQRSLYEPLERIRIKASSIRNWLYEFPDRPSKAECECVTYFRDLQLIYCEWVDEIIQFDCKNNVEKDVFTLVKDATELAKRYRTDQSMIKPGFIKTWTRKTHKEKQDAIKDNFKNALQYLPFGSYDINKCKKGLKRTRAMARITNVQRVLRVLDEFIKAAESLGRIHLEMKVEDEST
ncbi:hypothetical protein DM02DRAFT_726273 [Periconia macrospinosa]|uniref:Uncharacterized protein n=1 Tax=Periconia macrospinosa TaxID=97972 RepID=A0A2V1DZX5_9PLEO|nr:hypothetical protein DM02DRAFT_726273 [Periconia macrospinosa]